MPEDRNQADDFARQADERQVSLPREFWEFLKHNKKWWLLPILLVLLVIGLLAVLGSAGVGAFMYTVF